MTARITRLSSYIVCSIASSQLLILAPETMGTLLKQLITVCDLDLIRQDFENRLADATPIRMSTYDIWNLDPAKVGMSPALIELDSNRITATVCRKNICKKYSLNNKWTVVSHEITTVPECQYSRHSVVLIRRKKRLHFPRPYCGRHKNDYVPTCALPILFPDAEKHVESLCLLFTAHSVSSWWAGMLSDLLDSPVIHSSKFLPSAKSASSQPKRPYCHALFDEIRHVRTPSNGSHASEDSITSRTRLVQSRATKSAAHAKCYVKFK